MKTILSCLFACLWLTVAQAQNVIKRSVYFDTDKSDLREQSIKTLQKLMDTVATFKTYSIVIRGNTDADADSMYNIHLSERRSKAVYDYLRSHKMCACKLKIESLGENKPVAVNTTDLGKQRNRRVDIFITYEPKPKQIDPGISELFRQIEPGAQEFCVNPNRDTTITAAKGTIITIKAGAFPTAKCPCVNLRVTEYMDRSDFLMGNMATTANGKLLESGGMLKMEATCNGKVLNNVPGLLTIQLPSSQQLKSDMLFFAGSPNESGLNWLVDRNTPIRNFNFYNPRTKKVRPLKFRETWFQSVVRDMGEWVGIKSKYREMARARYQQQLADAQNEEADRKRKTLTAADEEVNYYVFSPPSMSYINCDRFAASSTPLVQFKVKVNPDDDIYTAIVFKDIRSMMTGWDQGTEMVFSNVPKGQRVWLVALKYKKDGACLALQEQITSGTPVENLEFKKYDIAGLKEALKVLN